MFDWLRCKKIGSKIGIIGRRTQGAPRLVDNKRGDGRLLGASNSFPPFLSMFSFFSDVLISISAIKWDTVFLNLNIVKIILVLFHFEMLLPILQISFTLRWITAMWMIPRCTSQCTLDVSIVFVFLIFYVLSHLLHLTMCIGEN